MSTTAPFITPDALLSHWQGHRRVTRRLVEAFPDDQLFAFSVGGMRPFGALALEMLGMAVPMVRGVVTGEWSYAGDHAARPKQELLRLWDESTEQLNALWPQIQPQRFGETTTAFGQFTGRSTTSSCTSSTTRFITAGRATCTCARSGSSRQPSTIAADPLCGTGGHRRRSRVAAGRGGGRAVSRVAPGGDVLGPGAS